MIRLLKIYKRDKDSDQNTITYIKVNPRWKSLKVGRQNNIIIWWWLK